MAKELDGIQVGAGFSLQSAEPLDNRLQYLNLDDLKNMAESSLYDGILAFVLDTRKTYRFDSKNSVDPNTGKWRKFEAGEITPVTEWSEIPSDENIPSEKLVKDALNSVRLIVTTWSDLKVLRDSKKLVPGMVYRITDYVCTTTQADTRAKNNLFDILVTALDKETLDENASAIYHEGDTYFTNEALPIWELKYCLDNDTTRFAWADTENGKGVIWYLKDEYENECAYDFKNIQFLRNKEFNTTYSTNVAHYYLTAADYYYYTFTIIDSDNNVYDMSCHNTVKVTTGINWKCAKNSILGYSLKTDINTRQLTNNVFCGNVAGTSNEKSVYCNNILGNSNTLGGRNVRNNIFMSNVISSFFADEGYCYGNTFEEAQNVIFKGTCFDNIAYSVFKNNVFYKECRGNNFNAHFMNNTFKSIFSFSTVGDRFQNNTFNQSSIRTNYGHDFIGNIVDCYLENNTFGNRILYVHFKGGSIKVINYYMASGLNGTSTKRLEVTPITGNSNEHTISTKTDGTLVDYCTADIADVSDVTLEYATNDEVDALFS